MEIPDLRGKTVWLRPLVAGDAEAVAKASPIPKDAYPYSFLPGNSRAEAEAYIAAALQHQRQGHRMPFAIIWNGTLVGSTSYWEMENWSWPPNSPWQRKGRPDALEIGATWLAGSAQRTRCNTEAKYLLLSHAFETWEVHRVSFRTDERNERSRRAIERLGASFEGVRRADRPGADGIVRNSAYYSVIRSEWPKIKVRLESFLSV